MQIERHNGTKEATKNITLRRGLAWRGKVRLGLVGSGGAR